MWDPQRSSDRQLIERFRQGDRDAFAALYRTHSPAVFRFALHMTADRHKAGEITQEVFVWLIHHAGEFDAERGGLGAFLCGVARNVLRRSLRDERRWLPFDEMASPPMASQEDREAAESSVDAAALQRAIAALPVLYREALVMCGLEGKSYEEAAAALGCPLGTVRSRVHRARDLLAQKLRTRSSRSLQISDSTR
jgi:RNA polymerase sigma-70 factor (ECF subfamily)